MPAGCGFFSSMHRLSYTALLMLLLLAGCATYYQRNIKFQSMVGQGELEKAEKMLASDKKVQKDRNRLLYLFNMGFLNHVQGEFEESNKFFNEADLWIEDYQKNYGAEALALITNPEVKPYKAEDFEAVLIYYYKAVNYLNLGDYDGALVEARRMNLRLNQLNDKYPDHKNRYQSDAFAHIIMGLAYEATGQVNDAFIAYRNAYEVYTGEHGYFGIGVPEQLKKDLLRTSYALGFQNDFLRYKEEFGMEYKPENFNHGEVVFLWHNGMGPVKDEFSINFIAVPGQAGFINFTNEELGLTFPFYIGDDPQKKNDLLALHIIRVAFPKYLERPTYYTEGWLTTGSRKFTLEKAEDVNAIAFKTLEDRFLREMGTSLLRLALKKIAEIKLQQQNEALGAVATITNAVTEKADTRNWQTLPHSIFYARVPLESGSNVIELNMKNKDGGTDRATFTFEGRRGAHYMQPYHSLEHLPAASWDVGASTRMNHQ